MRPTWKTSLPALRWPREVIQKHRHHHHRFDGTFQAPGAEMETSRGCPYHCTFCAKDNFRNSFRRRPLGVIAEELDGLVAEGVEYVYFIDEIFLPFRDVLETIRERGIRFGIQTRIDLWNEEMIHLLGSAGCVSIEAGVESITEAGRSRLDKNCRVSTEEISRRLVLAKESAGIAFVQGNLLDSQDDDPAKIRGVAGRSAAARRVVERAGALVSVSRLSGLHAALGQAGRPGVGACSRLLSGPLR